ncbi:nitroreductase/quinone reductase family protein [Aromatoleum anaerobium]|uniref:Nitroreductase family deazaflavin-dependent oxidoreductase n=1 Tax=Aromatoleum anaerobium TaxID=182180 RepID=A0ABX1PMU4_9RHOO|nr:nitroreductase/quinone reductase family protein [Aromatoleum anaerobium]MCK0508156.1 nitroreductase family deazaflavin-dependent oxidoreductase [Aromatoleum anaerobium]
MSTHNRENMVKPDYMSEDEWQAIKEATESLARIRGDAKADVERYLANPDGWSTGKGSPSGFPTLLLTAVGRKSGEKRTTPLVFLQNGDDMVVVGSLAGYDSHPTWYLNVSADPKCWVQLDRNKMAAMARDATDEERKELWPRLTALFPPWGFFQEQTDRPFAIVIISPTGPA